MLLVMFGFSPQKKSIRNGKSIGKVDVSMLGMPGIIVGGFFHYMLLILPSLDMHDAFIMEYYYHETLLSFNITDFADYYHAIVQ